MDLNRIDYNIVGLVSRKCLKILPVGKTGLQKIAVGDADGILHIFSIKNSEIFEHYEVQVGGGITCLELGGPINCPRDKIFVARDNEIRGYTKKGKQFLGFDTNVTDTIKSFYVMGSDLFVCASQTLHIFHDCHEGGNGSCGDKITDVVALDPDGMFKLMSVLSCEDKTLKILDGSKFVQSVPIASVPTVLEFLAGDQVLFGCSDGSAGCLRVSRQNATVLMIVESGKAEVTSLSAADLIESGQLQLILGRDDGNVEVYTFPLNGESSRLLYSYSCNESISAIQAGLINSPNYPEILVATFSGWVFGLTSEERELSSTNARLTKDANKKIEQLRKVLEELEEKASKEREKYQMVGMGNDAISAIPPITIKDKFFLVKEDASYSLSLEVQTSIDNVLIQSEVPVDLLDVQKNSAVISFSECDPKDGNFLLATYRCQFNTTRLDLKLRTIEGQYGIIRAYITPNLQPKCCHVQEYQVKPLSLHSRIHAIDEKRPYNTLNVKGGFSLAEMHSWIGFCLPEVPEKATTQTQTLCFESTFLGTMLQCVYTQGEVEFKSDNISTISILKDVLSKEATRGTKKRNIEITWDLQENSIPHTLSLIHPKLSHQLSLQRKAFLLEGLSELDTAEGISDEYREILSKEKEILAEFQQQPAYLDRLYGMITDLYIDKFKFQGVQVRQKIPALMQIFSPKKYSYESLLQFFYT